MKKHNIIFSFTALLILCSLVSCGSLDSGTSISSADIFSSSEERSDIDSQTEPSSISSLTKEEKEDKDLVAFRKLLKAKEGKVCQKTSTDIITNYYLTEGTPLSVTAKRTSIATRYGKGEQGPITEINGTTAFLDDQTGLYGEESSYQTQTYHDDDYFYRVTLYQDDIKNVEKIEYDHNYDEKNLSVSYTNEAIQDIDAMRDMVNLNTYVLDYDGITEDVENGIWSFHYQFTQYDTDLFTILQVIRFENKITITDNVITKTSIHYENAVYAGNIKTNWSVVESSSEYTQGDFSTFEGTYLNHE